MLVRYEDKFLYRTTLAVIGFALIGFVGVLVGIGFVVEKVYNAIF